jgi:hypothetical protein
MQRINSLLNGIYSVRIQPPQPKPLFFERIPHALQPPATIRIDKKAVSQDSGRRPGHNKTHFGDKGIALWRRWPFCGTTKSFKTRISRERWRLSVLTKKKAAPLLG